MTTLAERTRGGSHRPGLESSALKAEDFDYIRRLLREETAIDLDETKAYFIEARLEALASGEGFASSVELMARLKQDRLDGLRSKAIEAMTPNETSFFRDARPFDEIRRSVLPDLIGLRGGHRRLKVWSAACSSGQEPYSLAMMLLEHFPDLAGWDLSILASDLSTNMIKRAREGHYSQAEVNRGLPVSLLVKYFRREGLEWTINEPVRRLVDFRAINLVGRWPVVADLDLMILRNALIYLGIEERKAILSRVARVLAPDGYLWLGTAETTINIDERFERVELERGSLYQLRRP